MYAPDRDTGTPPAPPPGRDSSRNARYAYLVGRLRNRQITMEEATELFTIMQSMIQTSEAARAALMRVPPSPPGVKPPPPPSTPAAPAGPPVFSDDMLLVGLLAMGAGAGLFAATTKRLRETTPAAPATSTSRSTSVAAARKG